MTSISDLRVLFCCAEAGAMARKAIARVVVINNSTCFIVKSLGILFLDYVNIQGRLYEADDKVKVFGVELSAELLVKVCRSERYLVML